jgi:hypothetical protein
LQPESEIEDVSSLPFLPSAVFKRLSLQSVSDGEVVRILRSSATSSGRPSRIALDAITRNRQMRSLAVLMNALIGGRRPIVVLDAPPARTGGELPARVAGMRGYLMMASETHYVMETRDGAPALAIDHLHSTLQGFLERRAPVCLLGYTYIVHRYVVAPLLRLGSRYPLPAGSILLHFGGWKRLEEQAVDRAHFNADVEAVFGGRQLQIRDIYGFTEQLGIIYPDDGCGVRLVPAYSEVRVRDPFTLKLQPDGVPGLLQFITPLPHSYPGVSLLLDDIGQIVSRDIGVDGRFGTRFEVLGRAKGAEIRGCGDTLPDPSLPGGLA